MPTVGVHLPPALAATFDAAAAAEGGHSRVLRRLVEDFLREQGAGAVVDEAAVKPVGRSEKLTLRLRAEELSVLGDISTEAGFTRTSWVTALVRARLLNRPTLNPEDAVAYRQAHRELNRIGVNLNQVARAMNTAVLDGTVLRAELQLIEEVRSEFRRELKALRQALKGNLTYWNDGR